MEENHPQMTQIDADKDIQLNFVLFSICVNLRHLRMILLIRLGRPELDSRSHDVITSQEEG
jgi:hypothetical protein